MTFDDRALEFSKRIAAMLLTSTRNAAIFCLLGGLLGASVSLAEVVPESDGSIDLGAAWTAQAEPIPAPEGVDNSEGLEESMGPDPLDVPITELSVDISPPKPTEDQVVDLPPDDAAQKFADFGPPIDGRIAYRGWPVAPFGWEATGYCHQPLYFQQINVERYGYGHHHVLQPFVCAAHFFGTIPTIPYQVVAMPPHECVYTLGKYRPGNLVPYRHQWIPLRLDASAAQVGTVAGLILLIP